MKEILVEIQQQVAQESQSLNKKIQEQIEEQKLLTKEISDGQAKKSQIKSIALSVVDDKSKDTHDRIGKLEEKMGQLNQAIEKNEKVYADDNKYVQNQIFYLEGKLNNKIEQD